MLWNDGSSSNSNNGSLRLFGYGSLCWNPGSADDAILSKLSDGVTRTLGQAIGWKRCWAQKSADHRGNPNFPGIVCTLLSDDEYHTLTRTSNNSNTPSLTEGMIYTVPPELVEACLSELDFREKGVRTNIFHSIIYFLYTYHTSLFIYDCCQVKRYLL